MPCCVVLPRVPCYGCAFCVSWRDTALVCTVSTDRVRVYPRTKGTNQNRHWNHHRWHAERTRLSCWCLWNHKGCTYRAPVRYVTTTWSVVILNKKYIYCYLKCVVYDKLLKPRQSFRVTLYLCMGGSRFRVSVTLHVFSQHLQQNSAKRSPTPCNLGLRFPCSERKVYLNLQNYIKYDLTLILLT